MTSTVTSGIQGKGLGEPSHPPKSTDADIQPIPPLPPPVSGYPTPWFDEDDVEKYLLPLYTRGWGISFKKIMNRPKTPHVATGSTTGIFEAKQRPVEEPIRAQLTVDYEFNDYATAIAFVNGVAEIATTEDHHPRVLSIQNAKFPIVSLVTQTDSSKRPVWDHPGGRKMRGLTLRDLRFAILVETLYSGSYDLHRNENRAIRPQQQRPRWPRLLRYLKYYSLPKAEPGLESDISPSPSPSPSVDLSQVNDAIPSGPKSRPGSPCSHCGMNHPTEICPLERPYAPCPQCGGDHYVADCPGSNIP